MKSHRLAVVVALLAGLIAIPLSAENLPSSKATFAFSELIALQVAQNGEGANETPWTDILEVTLKTANKKDLLIIPSVQCGLVTDGTVRSRGGNNNSTVTRSQIRVRIQVTLSDGTVGFAVPNNGSDATFAANVEGITYCDRIQTLAAKFAGLNCTADLVTGEVTCADPEELQLILETLNANAFVFAFADVISGVTTVTVQAKASAEVELDGADGSLGSANAFIGAGSVSVEEVRFIKDLELDFDA